MRRIFEMVGKAVVVLGFLLTVTGPFWIGGPIELHGWDGRSPVAMIAGLILAFVGWLLMKVSRGGSGPMRMALSLAAGLVAFAFMVPASYSVGCADSARGDGGCEVQAVSNIAGVPIPAFNWFPTMGVSIVSAVMVWILMARSEDSPSDD